jgi:hypothetical protein
MTHHVIHPEYQEYFEYHGNTSIEHVRVKGGQVERDWIFFNSAEEALEFFSDACV